MPLKAIKKDQLLMVRGTPGQGLTARGRVMQSPVDQLVHFRSPNEYVGLYLIHVSGPLKGIRIRFTTAIARKARIRNVCLCDAYAYPHWKGAGQCKS